MPEVITKLSKYPEYYANLDVFSADLRHVRSELLSSQYHFAQMPSATNWQRVLKDMADYQHLRLNAKTDAGGGPFRKAYIAAEVK